MALGKLLQSPAWIKQGHVYNVNRSFYINGTDHANNANKLKKKMNSGVVM
jgi:hypothetical protein